MIALLPLLAAVLASTSGPRPEEMQVGTPYPSGTLVTTNQLLRPAGLRTTFSGTPADLAVSPDGQLVAVSAGARVLLYSAAGALLRTLTLPAPATFMGLAFSADGARLAVSHTGGVTVYSMSAAVSPITIALPEPVPCGLAFDPVRPYLYVALNTRNLVARIDLNLAEVSATVPAAVAPLALAVMPAGERLFVTNWAGRRPLPGDLTALSNNTAIVIDTRGIAATGTVTAVDLEAFSPVAEVDVGLHPGAIAISPDGSTAAVANANSDSISFLDTVALRTTSSTAIGAFPQDYTGSTPAALAFNRDGSRLYVACAGNNSIAGLALRNGRYEVDQFAPTDWYPVALGVAQDKVYVANAKGIGSRNGKAPYMVSGRTGSVNRLDTGQFAGPAEVAGLNDLFRHALVPPRARPRPPRSGDPASLRHLGVRHVFLIIKENRTFDQLLGDLPGANGDPKLAIYGGAVTPNHHQLASTFVTLDNFYATGVVSVDGHQWITQAMASDYVERGYAAGWPRGYAYSGEDPMSFASTGFLWDNARRNGLSARIFGEFTVAASSYSRTWAEYLQDAQSPSMRFAATSRSSLASNRDLVETGYPTFSPAIPDQFRARIFLDRFNEWIARGEVPNLVLIWLPGDHTAATTPKMASPASMIADNDLALGRIVEAISNSSVWPSSAIFAVEDDSQDGFDHVDGHRTVCLIASPFAIRRSVDSTSYNQTSVVRTIEELLGLPPMNKFDGSALPMRSVFTVASDLTPYRALPNQVPLDTMNPVAAYLQGPAREAALASLRMNFEKPDAAPEGQVNRILWRLAKGWGRPYPSPRHRRDCEMDDDDRTVAEIPR